MKVSGIPYVQGRNSYSDRDSLKFGIAIHNTSNDASDAGEASYAKRRTDGTSSHFYVDGDSVTQSLDTSKRAGHSGSVTGNENAIAVEITGGNGKSRAWWLANVDWAELGAVLAKVIRAHWPDGSFKVRRASVAEMRSNPKVRAFYGHDDMRRAWGGTTHTDPGPNFPWDRLFESVNAALGAPRTDKEEDMPTAKEIAQETVKQLMAADVAADMPLKRAVATLLVRTDYLANRFAPTAAKALAEGVTDAELAAALAAAVDQVPTADENAQAVMEALAAGSLEQTAVALRVIFGDRSAELGRLLSSAAPTQP